MASALQASNLPGGGSLDARMTQDDLVKDLSPQMNSIEESAKQCTHHAASLESYGQYQSQLESRHRKSIEREIEHKVRMEVNYDLKRKMDELNDKEAYLN